MCRRFRKKSDSSNVICRHFLKYYFMNVCSHALDTDEVCKNLFFTMTLTKAWEMCISSKKANNKKGICLHCYKILNKGNEFKKHTMETKHTMFFSFNPFCLFCIKCKTYIKCSDKFIKYAALALPLSPLPPLCNGFNNLGRSCFSSSVFVALSHCRPIIIAACASQNPFCRLFAAAGTKSRQFNQVIHDIIIEDFPTSRSADSAEFLLFLLTKLTEDKNIQRIIDGKISNRRYCRRCGRSSNETQSFMCIPIPLVNDGWAGQPRVSPAMPRSFGLDDMWRIDGNESGYSALVSVLQHGDPGSFTLERCLGSAFLSTPSDCSDCGKDTAVYFQTIDELPEVLILHLERFGKRWFGIGKFHQFVSFPAVGVDFGHFVPSSINCGTSLYDLVSVISHSGFMNTGHYTCYAKNDGKWFLFDDTSVKEVSEKELLASQAYLLFYTKRASVEVLRVREYLESNGVPWDQWIPIATLSNPLQWEKTIMHSEFDELFRGASELAEADVLRERTSDDIRSQFCSRFSLSDGDVYVSQKVVDVAYDFIEGNSEIPSILDTTGDISVGSGIVMFESLTK